MRKFVILSLVAALSLQVSAQEEIKAEEKVRVVPDRKNGIEDIKSEARHNYRAEHQLDATTFFNLMQHLQSHEDEKVQQNQIVAGSVMTSLGVVGVAASVRYANKFKSGRSRNAFRGASILAAGLGLYEFWAANESGNKVEARDARIQSLVDTPIDRAIRYKLGEREANRLLGEWQAYRTPEEMIVTWVEPEDLLWLDEQSQDALPLYLALLSNPESGDYISDPAKREAVAQYAADRESILRLNLRDLSKRDQARYEALLQGNRNNLLAEIKKRFARWNPTTAELMSDEAFKKLQDEAFNPQHVPGNVEAPKAPVHPVPAAPTK